MATFYFNAAVDGDWQTLGNWWMSYNAGTNTHSVPATALPTSADSIQVRADIGNSGSEPTVVNASFFGTANLGLAITVTGNCTFNDDSRNQAIINGNCTFNDSSHSVGTYNGRINGNATFTNSSYTRDPLEAYAASVVTGTVTFSSPTPVTFTLTGGGWLSDTTEWVFAAQGPSWSFNGLGNYGYSYNYGVIMGDATFTNAASNNGIINGNATFLNGARNGGYEGGTVNGNATFTDSYSEGAVNGSTTLNGTSRHVDWTWPGAILNGPVTFNDYSYTEGRVVGTATFNHFSYNNAGGGTSVVDGDAVFNNNSTNGGRFGGAGLVTGDAVFNDTATCGGDPDLNSGYFGSLGTVEGTARFTLSAAASQMSAARRAEFGSLEFIYDKGINGSSILGIL